MMKIDWPLRGGVLSVADDSDGGMMSGFSEYIIHDADGVQKLV